MHVYLPRHKDIMIQKISGAACESGRNSTLQPTLNIAFSNCVAAILNTHTA